MIYKQNPMPCDNYTPLIVSENASLSFGEAMPDSRLTELSDGKIYKLREAIVLSKKLGRPLTDDEMNNFIA